METEEVELDMESDISRGTDHYMNKSNTSRNNTYILEDEDHEDHKENNSQISNPKIPKDSVGSNADISFNNSAMFDIHLPRIDNSQHSRSST